MVWIPEFARDLDSDFRVFYRKTWDEMVRDETGPTFFALCYRVSAYAGVMQARMVENEETPVVDSVPTKVADPIETTPGAIARAGMGDLFEFGGR